MVVAGENARRPQTLCTPPRPCYPAAMPGNTARLAAKWNGVFALRFYLPFSSFSRAYRGWWRAVRGRSDTHQQRTLLQEAPWQELIPSRPVCVVGARKANGNVRLSELAVLAKAAAAAPAGLSIIEIGTFDGRTTLNLAVNSPADTKVFTLDLPPDVTTRFELEKGERQFVEKPAPGERYRRCRAPWSQSAVRITQLHGDSAVFDWSPYAGTAGLVFVDGSHTYEYAAGDSETAFRLVASGGMIIWHDYGVWEGVTRALEDLETARQLGLRKIRGTSLAFWRAPKVGQ